MGLSITFLIASIKKHNRMHLLYVINFIKEIDSSDAIVLQQTIRKHLWKQV